MPQRPSALDENIDLCPVFLNAIISALKNGHTQHTVAETHCELVDLNEALTIDPCLIKASTLKKRC